MVKKLVASILVGIIVLINGTLISHASNVSEGRDGQEFNELENIVDSEFEDETEIAEKKEIDLLKLIEEAINFPKVEELVSEEIDLEYTTTYENDATIPSGMFQVAVEGRDGLQQVITKRSYHGDEVIKEEFLSTRVIKGAINKVVHVGTMKVTNLNLYKIKKKDTAYVTSYVLNVYEQPSLDAEKRTTLKKGDEVKIVEIQSDWYYISYLDITGWVRSECIAKRVLTQDGIESGKQYTKAQLLQTLSFNMVLNKPSGLSLEQFKKVLGNDSRDKNKIFEQNAEYFYYIEQQYKINGIFVAAIGVHESAFGTSKICLDKNNIFGYGAYDRDPYNSAYDYGSYAEGIDMIARVLVKYYINPKGTSIYEGQSADGKYYNGNTLSAVNKRYATDTKWANGVYSWMQYLYNRL